MIKLSDYLDYLNNEIIQARKRADENAVKIAKEYAQHEYLKYFRVPRFSMPTVKMDIPLKITDIDSETKYDFKIIPDQFVKEVNEKIDLVNSEKKLNIPKVDKDQIDKPEFKEIFKKVENRDYKFIRDINTEIIKADLKLPVIHFLSANVFSTQDAISDAEKVEMEKIFADVLISKHRPVSTKLNELYIDPDTSKASDKDKLLVNLHVEMIEEGIRIVRIKDKNGKEIEEITFE